MRQFPHLKEAMLLYGIMALLWVAAFVGGWWLIARVT